MPKGTQWRCLVQWFALAVGKSVSVNTSERRSITGQHPGRLTLVFNILLIENDQIPNSTRPHKHFAKSHYSKGEAVRKCMLLTSHCSSNTLPAKTKQTPECMWCSCKEINAPNVLGVIGAILPVQGPYQGHVVLGQLKVEYLEVLSKSLDLWCFRDDDYVPLDGPPENNLWDCLLMLLSKTLNQKREMHIRYVCKNFSSIKQWKGAQISQKQDKDFSKMQLVKDKDP